MSNQWDRDDVRWCFSLPVFTCIHLISWLRVCFSHFLCLWFFYQMTIISLQLPLPACHKILFVHVFNKTGTVHDLQRLLNKKKSFFFLLIFVIGSFLAASKNFIHNRCGAHQKIGSFILSQTPQIFLLRYMLICYIFHYTSTI